MSMLNGMIQTGRLQEFVLKVIGYSNEDQEDKTLWDFWLHKVFDKSYAEWKESINTKAIEPPKQEDIKKAVRESFNILNSFVPDGGAVNDGTIPAARDRGH